MTLRRTVRFAINPSTAGDRGTNGYGGVPSLLPWGRTFELTVSCSGIPDPATGYLINIKAIDDAVRRTAVPALAAHIDRRADPAACVPDLLQSLRHQVPVPVVAVRLHLTPTLVIDSEVTMGTRVVLAQKFEIAAAHRLHSPALSDAENRAFFGKCNNPAGHGHNYVIEPRVEIGTDASRAAITLAELEEITQRVLVEPFDHKHLNLDTPEFSDHGGLNPTVENIAMVFFRLLSAEIARLGRDARLREITVWETDRTSATFGPTQDSKTVSDQQV
ncbi:MAG: 6-carboxytetrahydropterin synthase [Phycisphaeraceae bacterium]|nr:6-carboxytetrahydropterin synthase [Phycisphaeraceae bacterium]QYK46776.1 MAG: 6-carboxytetrahydropterin synthase [Phycisphaeraceae bacterium]